LIFLNPNRHAVNTVRMVRRSVLVSHLWPTLIITTKGVHAPLLACTVFACDADVIDVHKIIAVLCGHIFGTGNMRLALMIMDHTSHVLVSWNFSSILCYDANYAFVIHISYS